MSDDIVENLRQPSHWFRIAFMVAMAIVLYVVSLVLTVLTVAQALFSVFTGSDNENLRSLGKDLSTYVHQILEFLTYNSEVKPFPFSPYPVSEPAPASSGAKSAVGPNVESYVAEANAAAAESTESPQKPPRAPRKPAVKKTPPAATPPADATDI